MKKSINIYNNVNLIPNTYMCLFFKLLLKIFNFFYSFKFGRRVSKTVCKWKHSGAPTRVGFLSQVGLRIASYTKQCSAIPSRLFQADYSQQGRAIPSRLFRVRQSGIPSRLFRVFIYFIFYLFNVGNKNIQLKLYRRNSFSIKRKC